MKEIKKSKYTEEFTAHIFNIARDYFAPNQVEQLLRLFYAEFSKYKITQYSVANLQRILDSLMNRFAFFNDALRYNHHIEIIVALSFNSNYLTDIVVRNPEFLYQIFDQIYLEKELDESSLEKEISNNLCRYKGFNAKVNYLRFIKRRFTLKIGITDILQLSGLESITKQISLLAKIISHKLFSLCFDAVAEKYNCCELPHEYAIVSLGKLGGNELNYSSDIDLLFMYRENYFIKGQREIEYNEIVTEAIRLFVQTSNTVSESGFIYRVDLRLRPDGAYSPLARSLNNTILYYETRGENWERQMLIKSGFAGGDKDLYDSFISRITPFIYPKSFLESPVEKVLKLRSSMESSVQNKDNIKQSAGGIRDIEFTVQVLQLLNGGKSPELRTGTTLDAINLLEKYCLLPSKKAAKLRNNYIFYRKIEHFLQLMNNTQTHDLPKDQYLFDHLLHYMGSPDRKRFLSLLSKTMIETRRIFASYIKPGKNETQFDQIGFKDAHRAKKNLSYLKLGGGLIESKGFSSRTIELFESIENNIYQLLKKSANPDETLECFHSIIKSSGFASIWYKTLQRNLMLKDFLTLCEYSERFKIYLSSNPQFAERFFDGSVYTKTLEELFPDINTAELLFILNVQSTLRLINQKMVSNIITGYIDYQINLFAKKHLSPSNCFIAGLGSYGSAEMVLSSDIDLIIVTEKIENLDSVEKKCRDFTLDVNKILSPFKIDYKLRPEGKSSFLAWDISVYTNYLNKRAKSWEFQSLLKLNLKWGSETLFIKFYESLWRSYQSVFTISFSSEIKAMYNRILKEKTTVFSNSLDIKFTQGGLITLEYLIDLSIMMDPVLYKKMIGKNYLKKINNFDKEVRSKIKNNYIFLKQLEIDFQNILNISSSKLLLKGDKMNLLADFYKSKKKIKLHEHLEKVLTENSRLLQNSWSKSEKNN